MIEIGWTFIMYRELYQIFQKKPNRKIGQKLNRAFPKEQVLMADKWEKIFLKFCSFQENSEINL